MSVLFFFLLNWVTPSGAVCPPALNLIKQCHYISSVNPVVNLIIPMPVIHLNLKTKNGNPWRQLITVLGIQYIVTLHSMKQPVLGCSPKKIF